MIHFFLLFFIITSQAQIITYSILEKNGQIICLYGDAHTYSTFTDKLQCSYIDTIFSNHSLSDIEILAEITSYKKLHPLCKNNPIGLMENYKNKANVKCLNDIRHPEIPNLNHLKNIYKILDRLIKKYSLKKAQKLKDRLTFVLQSKFSPKHLVIPILQEAFDLLTLHYILESPKPKVVAFIGMIHVHRITLDLISMGYKVIDKQNYIITRCGTHYCDFHFFLSTISRLTNNTYEFIDDNVIPIKINKFDYISGLND